jgi:hypothetical protein
LVCNEAAYRRNCLAKRTKSGSSVCIYTQLCYPIVRLLLSSMVTTSSSSIMASVPSSPTPTAAQGANDASFLGYYSASFDGVATVCPYPVGSFDLD